MLWMVAALAAGEIAYEPKVAVPVLEPDASVAGAPAPVLLTTGFDLGATRDRTPRLGTLHPIAEAETTRDPFTVSALEDERQRLTFGVKPGLRRARIGLSYNLALD